MKNRMLVLMLAALSLTLILTACGSSSSGGGGGVKALGEVSALYSTNGADWNDYVKGGNITNATDTACDPDTDTACVHAGEIRMVGLLGQDACTGITAADEIGAFNWTCNDSTGVATLISNGLASGYGLANLIEFATPGWKENSVTAYKDGSELHITSSAVWWSNPVVVNTTGGDLASEGTVYVIADSLDGIAYDIIANSVSLVAAPGVIINGPGAPGNVISAAGMDFIWVEGMVINAAGGDSGVYWDTVGFSTMRDITADYANSGGRQAGIYLDSSWGNTLTGVTVSNNGYYGVYLSYSPDNTLTGVTASDNDYGVWLDSSSGNTLTGVTASNNGYGVYLDSSWGNTLSSVTASNNGIYGVYLSYSPGNTLSGVTASNNSNYGVYLNASSDNTLSSVTVGSNYYGVYLFSSSGNTLTGVIASNSSNYGVWLNYSPANTLSGVTASNNGIYGVYLNGSSDNTLSSVTASNNGIYGVWLDSSSDNTLTGVTASNNGTYGVYLSSSSDNTLSGITASSNNYGVNLYSSSGNTLSATTVGNNSYSGVYLNGSSDNTFSGVTASNNGWEGILLGAYADGNTLSDVTAVDNGTYGIKLNNSSNNYFTGLLKVGGNWKDCYISKTITITNPGLDDDSTPGDVETDTVHNGLCIQQGASDFGTAVTGLTLASSFIANIVSDDTVNTGDTDGTATYASITDWVSFENIYRAWGKYSADAFPSANHRGVCATGQTCQIWDWSLYASDTVLVNSLSYPDTGDIANTLTHFWSGAPDTDDNAGCEAMVTGSLWNTDHCETTSLRSAVEIAGGMTGNDNTLCETGETCLYTPNMGAYQGHGDLISAGEFTDGVITGVTLMKFETNGY